MSRGCGEDGSYNDDRRPRRAWSRHWARVAMATASTGRNSEEGPQRAWWRERPKDVPTASAGPGVCSRDGDGDPAASVAATASAGPKTTCAAATAAVSAGPATTSATRTARASTGHDGDSGSDGKLRPRHDVRSGDGEHRPLRVRRRR